MAPVVHGISCAVTRHINTCISKAQPQTSAVERVPGTFLAVLNAKPRELPTFRLLPFSPSVKAEALSLHHKLLLSRTFMPADRLKLHAYVYTPRATPKLEKRPSNLGSKPTDENKPVRDWADGRKAQDVYYPRTTNERASFKLGNGKRIPPHHWDVYDYILNIPAGKVTTYKEVSSVVGGSPRSVGNALRSNPFMPYVPCHRVIASDLTLGGYFGEWGETAKTGTRYHQKLGILAKEGVEFTEHGKIASPTNVIWKPF